jgi:predicted amidohydrolase
MDLEILTQVIREKVEETLQGKLRPIELAALLWKACNHLWLKVGISQIPEEWHPEPAHDLRATAALLYPFSSPTELYRILASMLVSVETEIDPPTEKLVQTIFLESLQPNPPLLTGEVQIWFRERSVLQRARDRRRVGEHREMKYWLEPDRHLRVLSFYSPSDRPEVRLLPVEADRGSPYWAPLLHSSAALAREGSLRIALCSLRGAWRPQFDLLEDDEGRETRFVARQHILEEKPEALGKHLDQILQEVLRESIHILAFPELSIDEGTRELLREKLRKLRPRNPLLAVFAGTFHIRPKKKEYPHKGTDPYNEAVVWNGLGEPLWTQYKRGAFRLQPHQVKEEFFPSLKESPRKYPGLSAVEGIRQGAELVVVDSDLGRLTVLICADALEPGPGYKEVLDRVRPDLALILAMSEKTSGFDQERERLVQQDIGSLFVNAACVCKEGESDLAFIDLSIHEDTNLPPTRWRWLLGSAEPEWYRNRGPKSHANRALSNAFGREKEDRWHPSSEWKGRPPVRLLGNGAGLILDLGAYLRDP